MSEKAALEIFQIIQTLELFDQSPLAKHFQNIRRDLFSHTFDI